MKVAIAIKRRNRARDALFAAGWQPHTYALPITDAKIRKLLLALNAANAEITKQKLAR